MHLDDMLFFQLNLVTKHIHQQIRERLESYGIAYGQPPVLFILSQQDGMTQSEIACKINITKATMTKMIQRMEKSDLVYKQVDEQDKRNYHIYLSNKAKHILSEIELIYQKLEASLVNEFSEIELEQFKHYINRLNNQLEIKKS